MVPLPVGLKVVSFGDLGDSAPEEILLGLLKRWLRVDNWMVPMLVG
jgi:hypothetical protein